MLKRKLLKTGIIIQSCLLVVIPSASNVSGQTAVFHQPQYASLPDTGILQRPLADSSISLLHATASEALAEEPKVQLNARAVPFVENYLKTNNEALQKVKQRSAPYFKIIESVLRQNELPVELKYLAVVESELKAKARSRVGAVGPWQLMPSTARWLGLKVSGKHDERTHYYKSSVAAAKYLKSLYAEFGDWLLVIAAYNGGSGTVQKAIKKSGSKNFWYLQYHLPAETRGHVKRFIGAHYYFEAEGSETTLTKTELASYQKSVEEFRRSKVETAAEDVHIDIPQINDSVIEEVR